MKNLSLKNILIILAIVIAILGTWKLTNYFAEKKVEKARLELRKEIIKNDTLVKLRDDLFSKRVADTLKISQLKKLNDSLKLQIKDPKIITIIKLQPKDQTGEVDEVTVKDSIVSIKDYYPDKDDPFITYSADVNTNTKTGEGTFKLGELSLDIGIGQNEDGTYSLNTKVPSFMSVNSIDVQALPLTPVKKDKFGILAGGGVGKAFTGRTFMYLGGGVRINKTYLEVNVTSLETISTGIKIEF